MKTALIILPYQKGVIYAVLCYYFVDRLSPLPDAGSSQADE